MLILTYSMDELTKLLQLELKAIKSQMNICWKVFVDCLVLVHQMTYVGEVGFLGLKLLDQFYRFRQGKMRDVFLKA